MKPLPRSLSLAVRNRPFYKSLRGDSDLVSNFSLKILTTCLGVFTLVTNLYRRLKTSQTQFKGVTFPRPAPPACSPCPETLRPSASLTTLLLTYVWSGSKPEDTACPSCLTCVFFPPVPAAPAVSQASLTGRLRCSSNSTHSAQSGTLCSNDVPDPEPQEYLCSVL